MSKTINVIVIPADPDKPVRTDSYDSTDYKNLTALIFDGNRDGTFDRMTTVSEGDEITFWFDDDGLARLDTEQLADIVNLRAMELFAFTNDLGTEPAALHSFGVPLVGDYVITGGADDDGNSLDAPAWIAAYPFTWPAKIAIHRDAE
jgi:hypothetical protein